MFQVFHVSQIPHVFWKTWMATEGFCNVYRYIWLKEFLVVGGYITSNYLVPSAPKRIQMAQCGFQSLETFNYVLMIEMSTLFLLRSLYMLFGHVDTCWHFICWSNLIPIFDGWNPHIFGDIYFFCRILLVMAMLEAVPRIHGHLRQPVAYLRHGVRRGMMLQFYTSWRTRLRWIQPRAAAKRPYMPVSKVGCASRWGVFFQDMCRLRQ